MDALSGGGPAWAKGLAGWRKTPGRVGDRARGRWCGFPRGASRTAGLTLAARPRYSDGELAGIRAQWLFDGRYTEYNLGPLGWSEMRKLVVLLAIAALVSSVTTVLTGCGPPAPADQPVSTPSETTSPLLRVEDGPQAGRRLVAAPTEITSPLLKPTAAVSTPTVDNSVPAPAPAPSAGDGIEFAPVDSVGTSRKEEPIRVVGPDSTRKGVPGAAGPVEGAPYTWQDGDRAMTVKTSDRPGSRERLRRTAP